MFNTLNLQLAFLPTTYPQPACSLDPPDMNDPVPPCILLVSQLLFLPFFSVGCLACYFWMLMEARDSEKLIRTHRKRIAKLINNSIWWSGAFYGLIIGLLCFVMPFNTFKFLSEHNLDVDILATQVAISAAQAVAISLATLPCLALAVLYYSETVRLRLILSDFIGLLHMRPLPVELIGSAYLELNEEWNATQNTFGQTTNIFVLCSACFSIAASVVMFYVQSRDAWIALAAYSTAVAMYCFPVFFLIYVMAGANSTAQSINEEFTDLLADNVVGKDVLRLLMLCEHRPCELCIFGKRIDPLDLLTAVVAVASVNLFSALTGLSD